MNVKRFTGRTSREAMQKVKAAFGDDAVVLSTKPAAEGGIEILAMAGDSVQAAERLATDHVDAGHHAAHEATPARKPAAQQALQGVSALAATVQDDVKQLAMSTLSFQDYVRERMLRRRQAALQAQDRTEPALAATPEEQLQQRFAAPQPAARPAVVPPVDLGEGLVHPNVSAEARRAPARAAASAQPDRAQAERVQAERMSQERASLAASAHADLTFDQVSPRRETPRAAAGPDTATADALRAAQEANAAMLGELRSLRAMMKERFETMAFIEKLGRTPAQATLAQRLLDGGFSAVLIRKMLDAMPAEVSSGAHDEVNWATQVLQRNLNTADQEPAIEDRGGVFALIGSTGVGKTTTTAKLAAAFAAKHGAANLGLITLDAYRVGAHDQLRAYGRILGVPVHMAHDRAALEDLLELLSGKKLILIDTAGMAQRDSRTKELLDMLAHPSIRKLLVINSATQGDAIEDVMQSYQVSSCAGVVLSKLDEAVKLGPALDALIRHKCKVLGVANGQRVPEDWHRLSSHALVHRALRASLNPAYRLDLDEVNLVFSMPATTEAAPVRPV
ncbi:flagellar biosynthesis protein FlhF [Aquabacterium fontiphilum]|jgi:flagellar biosynthesis protein FlhF|uniref:flagellar biosynthesis protein FlhF n=1 Tax=Aquabacterium fontiphilum TaxID=450365 RepID=UPI001376CD5C|nr:flagellar biosynthesis protein FlhF [Aquabacterium fontiphilum]NBD20211.1 flagellar biosynthesis protein FlhF [Aquabacterium fontiphilum]